MIDSRVIQGLLQLNYIGETNHALLDPDAWRSEGGNIGLNGERLTITFLSMNRVELSRRLCSSIASKIDNFKGEVLVVDNGSDDNELEVLRAHLETMPYRWRLIELGKNHGVAGGRNITVDHINTDWAMFLDNDIYLVKNPLPKLQSEISTVGCHFLTLPLINEGGKEAHLRGGNLYVSLSEDGVVIGAGSTMLSHHTSDEKTVSLGTFLAGGACLIKKETFLKAGGYDNAMFIGFEDIEFSVRLFQQGYKVGSSECLAFIHDHPAPNIDADKDYEKKRFSREILYQSALHFRKKHGFIAWSPGVSEWVEMRQRELSLSDEVEISQQRQFQVPQQARQKPLIGLVIDVADWAFAKIANQIETHLSDEFRFFVVSLEYSNSIDEALYQLRHCDLVHVFWRDSLRCLGDRKRSLRVHEIFGGYDAFLTHCVHNRPLTTSVYDHLFLTPDELQSRAVIFNRIASAYTVSSQLLEKIYNNIPYYPLPAATTPDGVDINHFQPRNIERFQNLARRPLVVGWVGNSKWNEESGVDRKGLYSVLMPALHRLQSEGRNVTWQFADRAVKQVSHNMMPNYYAGIDVLVCASEIEGTPNPVLEAMACGVPVVSTLVGIVPEVFGPKQKQFILPERSVDAMYAALRRLIDEPHIAADLSNENLDQIQSWDWKHRAEAFRSFFRSVLKKDQQRPHT